MELPSEGRGCTAKHGAQNAVSGFCLTKAKWSSAWLGLRPHHLRLLAARDVKVEMLPQQSTALSGAGPSTDPVLHTPREGRRKLSWPRSA